MSDEQLESSTDILSAIYNQMVILNKNINVFNKRLDDVERDVASIKGAFVDGEYASHRNWHTQNTRKGFFKWLQ